MNHLIIVMGLSMMNIMDPLMEVYRQHNPETRKINNMNHIVSTIMKDNKSIIMPFKMN